MKLIHPEGLAGKELHQYLYTEKVRLKKIKKAGFKFSDGIGDCNSGSLVIPKDIAIKTAKAEHSQENGPLIIEVIANLSGWMDYDNDVLLRGAYNKSIADKGKDFHFLKDHIYRMDYIIAETLEVKAIDILPSLLGISSEATVTPQALIFRAKITPEISGDIYYKYQAGLVKQHSIGLRYVALELAINDQDFEEEFKTWNKYKSQVLNLSSAIQDGYFWAVPEIQLIENSAVVFGSNIQTPTLSVEEAKTAADTGTAKHIHAAVQMDTVKQNEFYTFLQSL